MGDYLDLRARQQVFEAIAGYETSRTVVHGGNRQSTTPHHCRRALSCLPPCACSPSPDGRSTPTTRALSSPPVVILGYELWQQQFRGDPAIIGRSVKIGVTPLPRQVVGIAPPGFRFPANAAHRGDRRRRAHRWSRRPIRKNGWTFAAARLKPGVSLEDADAHLAALSQQMEQEHPDQNAGSQYFVRQLRDDMLGETRSRLAAAPVGCRSRPADRVRQRRQPDGGALARPPPGDGVARRARRGPPADRHAARRRESRTRAGRGHLRGGLRRTGSRLRSSAWCPRRSTCRRLGTIRLDGVVLVFAGLISLGTTLLFSIFSAFGIRRDLAARALGSPGRATAGAAARRVTSALVAAEIALAIVLLSGAGLVLRSFSHLLAVDPGFSGTGVLTLTGRRAARSLSGSGRARGVAARARSTASERSLVSRRSAPRPSRR